MAPAAVQARPRPRAARNQPRLHPRNEPRPQRPSEDLRAALYKPKHPDWFRHLETPPLSRALFSGGTPRSGCTNRIGHSFEIGPTLAQKLTPGLARITRPNNLDHASGICCAHALRQSYSSGLVKSPSGCVSGSGHAPNRSMYFIPPRAWTSRKLGTGQVPLRS